MNIMKRFNSSLLLSFLCLLAITSCVSDSEEQEVSALEIATDPMYIKYFNNNTELIFDLKESLSIVDLENISLGELNHDDLSSLLQSDLFSSRDEIDSGISFQHSLMSQLDKKYNLSELPEQLIYHTLVEANRIILLENSKVKEKNGSCEVDYALCVAAAYAQAQVAILACAGPWVVPCVAAVLAIEAIQIVRCDRAYDHCRAPQR